MKACSCQKLAIIKTISLTEFNINKIFKHCLVKNEWLSKIDEIRQPRTIQKYLNSLQQLFYEFILCNKQDSVEAEDCNAMMKRVWNCLSVHKGRVKQTHKNIEKQIENLG